MNTQSSRNLFVDRKLQRAAIVLGTSVNGLGVIRSLGRLGIPCGTVYSPADGDHALNSRYLKASYPVTQNADANELQVALRNVAGELGDQRAVLIPTSDYYSQFLSENQDVLSRDYEPVCARKDLCGQFIDKWASAKLCQEYDILIPNTYCPQSMEQLVSIAARISYPVIVKPRQTFRVGFPGKNAVLSNADSLLGFFQKNAVIGNSIIQSIIPSGDGGIFVTASYSGADGMIKAIYSGRKLRQYLPDYGSTSFGVSEKQIELEQKTRQFLEALKYTGFAMTEYARSRDDGRLYFLELNTRTSWPNQLYADAGVDLTQIGYLDTIGQDYCELVGPIQQREGVAWLDFRRDFISMRTTRKKGDITLWDWLRSIVSARSFAYWSWRDPKPFIAAMLWRTRGLWHKYILPRR